MASVEVERREAVRAKRTRERRKEVVRQEFKRRGGRCEGSGCGARLVIGTHQWHHRDPEAKLFSISKAPRHTTERIVAELAKCELLCLACHTKIHPEGNWTNGKGRSAA